MASRSRKSNFILQGGILGIAGIITRIIGMLYRIPVTNIIGPEGNGYYAAAFQVYTVMLLISSYSLPLAVSKIVSDRVSKGQYKNADRAFSAAIIFALITGGIVCLLIFFGADFFASVVMSEPLSYIALRVFAPTLLVVALMGVVRGYFQGMGTMVPTAVSQIIEQIVNAIISILAARYLFNYGLKVAAILRESSFAPAYGAAGSTIGTSLGALSGLLFLLFVLVLFKLGQTGKVRKDSARAESFTSILWIIFITVIPVILSTAIYNICDLLSNSIFNKMMIKKGLGDNKSYIWGVFSGEYKILLNVPIALSNAMSASTVPTLTGCLAEGNIKSARRKISQAMRFTMLLAFPSAVGLGVLALPIMSMLFKDGYDLAASLMRIGAVNIIFFSISTLSNGILQGINKMNIPVRNAIITLVVYVSALYLMLDKTNLGIYAVIIANFIFASMMSILNHMAIRKYIHYKQEINRTFIAPALASAVMGVVIFALYKILDQALDNVISTIVCIVVGGIVYMICIIKMRAVKEDEIYAMPMGSVMVGILKSMRLL